MNTNSANSTYDKSCISLYKNYILNNRTYKITFVYLNNQEKEEFSSIFIDYYHVLKYTNFFEKKKELIDDSIYRIHFPNDIAIFCIESLHSLFSELTMEKITPLFLLCCDYFCIDILPYIKEKISDSYISEMYVTNFLENFNEMYESINPFLKTVDILLDRVYSKGFFTFTFKTKNKTLIKFLLTRKWKISGYNNYESISNVREILEKQLIDLMITYSENIPVEEFLELWNLIHFENLDIEKLRLLSNHRYSLYIKDDIMNTISMKLNLFTNSEKDIRIERTRYCYKIFHIDPMMLNIGDKVDVLDNKSYWQIATIIDKHESDILVHFEDDMNDIIINGKDHFRFLPYKSLCSSIHNKNISYCYCNKCTLTKIICPCSECVNYYKIIKN